MWTLRDVDLDRKDVDIKRKGVHTERKNMDIDIDVEPCGGANLNH